MAAPVLVTGGAGGIGGAIVAALAPQTPCVVWDVAGPTTPVPGVEYRFLDLTDQEAVAREVASGPTSWSAVVHCAGILHRAPITDADRSAWRRVIDVNLVATIELMSQVVERVDDHGRVVLLGSGTASKGPADLFAYVASKGGIEAFARSLARELGPRSVTVNVVAPGLTDTAMAAELADVAEANVATRAIARTATVDDVVGPVLFFLSPASAFVTGQCLHVDGGSVMH